jgi:hypothetical protein
MAVCMKNVILWDVTQCGFCENRLMKEIAASIIKVRSISELVATLAVTVVIANVVPSSLILSPSCWRRHVTSKRRFLQKPHSVTSYKVEFLEGKYGWRNNFRSIFSKMK